MTNESTTALVPFHKSKEAELKERKRILAPLQTYLISTVKSIEGYLARINIVKIEDNEKYQEAGRTLRLIQTTRSKLLDTRKNITRPMDDAKDDVMRLFSAADTNLKKKYDLLELSMREYREAVDAERKRKEDELLQEQLKLKKKEALKAEREARKLDAAGDPDAAAMVRDLAQDKSLVIPAVDLPTPKAEGIYEKKTWDFEIVNEAEIPREWLMPNESKIGKQVRASGDTVLIPGVRIFSVTTQVTKKLKEEVIIDAKTD